MPVEEILWNMQNKDFGNVEALQISIRGKIYHIMDIKETNYVMFMMAIYGTLENLEGLDTQRRYKRACGELVTKRFNYREVFGNHFNYRHTVEDNKNILHSTI